ncbi:MAG: DUF58 domain-containing protein [Sulfolobales archaeon]|nr:DUF58 domain-containing protein [Sulfolobales archaeon]
MHQGANSINVEHYNPYLRRLGNMSGRSHSLLTAIQLILMGSAVIYAAQSTDNPLYFIILAFLPVYVYFSGFSRLIAGFSWSLVYTAAYSSLYPIAVLVSMLSLFQYVLQSSEEDALAKIVNLILIYTPVYILSPYTLASATAVATLTLVLSFTEYLRLSSFKATISKTFYSTYLGEALRIPLEIYGKGSAVCRIYLNDKQVAHRLIHDRAVIELVVKPAFAGVHEYVIGVLLRDLRGLAKVEHRPLVLKLKVTPRSIVILKKAKLLLLRYIHEVKMPLVLYAKPSVALSQVVVPQTTGSIGLGVERSLGLGELSAGGLGREEGVGVSSSISENRGELIQRWIPRISFNWIIPTRVLERIEHLARSAITGEYIGAREYSPGDHFKMIHWKKSISKGILIVKEFSRGMPPGGGKSSIIIADWDASNPIELDLLIQSTYSAVFTGEAKKMVYLKVPSGGVYVIKGELLDVLSALDSIIAEEGVEARFNYESWARTKIVEGFNNAIENDFIQQLLNYYRAVSTSIIEELEKHGVERGAGFMVIHPRAYSLKYFILAKTLEARGYSSIFLKEVATLKEVEGGLEP